MSVLNLEAWFSFSIWLKSVHLSIHQVRLRSQIVTENCELFRSVCISRISERKVSFNFKIQCQRRLDNYKYKTVRTICLNKVAISAIDSQVNSHFRCC